MRFSDWGVDTGLGMLLSEAQEAPAGLRPVFQSRWELVGWGSASLQLQVFFQLVYPRLEDNGRMPGGTEGGKEWFGALDHHF